MLALIEDRSTAKETNRVGGAEADEYYGREKMGGLTEQRLQRKAISQSQHPTVRHARATMSNGTGRSMTSLKS